MPMLSKMVFLVLLVLAAPLPAEAFQVMRTQNGSEVHWPSDRIPVSYRVHHAGSADIQDGTDHAAIDAAFQTWEQVPCSSLEFDKGSDYTGTPTYSCTDGNNLVFWIESNWPADFGPEAIGVTTMCYNQHNGALADADIMFNGVNFQWATDGRPNAVDVQNIAAHEIGHFFGLGHSEYPDATMYYASAGNGETTKRTLHPDDEAGICYMYPTDCISDADCDGDYVCVRNRCEPPPVDTVGVGEACENHMECEEGTGSGQGWCLNEVEYGFRDGYCIILGCQPGSCPAGTECIVIGTDQETGDDLSGCLAACDTGSPDCRDGYVCTWIDADDLSRGVCWAACETDADCGQNYCDTDTGHCVGHRNDVASVGDGCTDHEHCPTGGFCLVEYTSDDPSYVGPPGGYCTKECGAGRPCPAGSSCYTMEGGGGPVALCLADCEAGETGECRHGYACWPAGHDPSTGGDIGACWLACSEDIHCSGDGSLVCNHDTGLCEPPREDDDPGDDEPGDPGDDDEPENGEDDESGDDEEDDGDTMPVDPPEDDGSSDGSGTVACGGCSAGGGDSGLLALLLVLCLLASRTGCRRLETVTRTNGY